MYSEIYEMLERQGKVKTAVILNGKYAGSKCIVQEGKCILTGKDPGPLWSTWEKELSAIEETGITVIDGTEIFVEIYLKNPHLILLGGGHVSCPAAHMGKMLGFHVSVMDDREEFISEERFPDADERIQGGFHELSEKIPAYDNAYYVILTRGHAGDSLCARQILRRPYIYLGMIGSKTKVKLTREKLMQEGFTEAELDTIHAPIGLPIGGQMPEEIAVSIMAEIVQVKNKHYAAFTDEKVQEAVQAGTSGVMMTIVRKSGSSPRGTGSKMFLADNGRSYGSIGGGSVEYEAMRHAAEVSHGEVQHYNLSVTDQKNLGMICGGRVDVFFERL
ncbi:MAG: XdhC family protein [Eubacteriales bacterium]|nr:XdhC family protein [Eubacteriales bacterium]